ncbi:hypothetical protein CDD83_1925 [Cordyceps sp. RAO-2017]|nr:hypothetical protein CDD83_1925 [Cordyceps sp. RAO-2017]
MATLALLTTAEKRLLFWRLRPLWQPTKGAMGAGRRRETAHSPRGWSLASDSQHGLLFVLRHEGRFAAGPPSLSQPLYFYRPGPRVKQQLLADISSPRTLLSSPHRAPHTVALLCMMLIVTRPPLDEQAVFLSSLVAWEARLDSASLHPRLLRPSVGIAQLADAQP